MIATTARWCASTLLITDHNLGARANQLLREECSDLTWLCWNRAIPGSKEQLLRQIASRQWELCISFYNDLIVPADLLGQMELAVNVHPALPSVRGVGYDTIPLIERHQHHGSTLHRMVREIDAGEIFHVIESPLRYPLSSTQLRRKNQRLCWYQLQLLSNSMVACRSVESLCACLTILGESLRYQWSESYVSRSELSLRLERLRRIEPNHGVFR